MVEFGLAWYPLDFFALLARRRMQDSTFRRLNSKSIACILGLLSDFGGAALRKVCGYLSVVRLN